MGVSVLAAVTKGLFCQSSLSLDGRRKILFNQANALGGDRTFEAVIEWSVRDVTLN